MIFSIPKSQISSPSYFFKRIGYFPIPSSIKGKASYIRHIQQTDFPRFHVYISQSTSDFNFDLHMDLLRPQHQKYARASENFGKPIEDEIERINSLVS